jgi:hypothetical protein
MEENSLKASHLARRERLHAEHRNKMGQHGVLLEARGGMPHVNLEAAYQAYHDGHDMPTILHQMGAPIHTGMPRAEARVAIAQDITMPQEKRNETI